MASRGLMLATLAVIVAGAMADLKSMLLEKTDWSDACVADTGFKAADPRVVWNTLDSDAQEGRCYMGCMLEKATVMMNGRFSAENSRKLAESCYEGEKLKTMWEIIDLCAAEVTTTDRCETGPNLAQCLRKYKVAKGFD